MSDKTLTETRFEEFSLHENLLRGLSDAGFVQCTPIQAMTLPLTLMGKDVAGQAQTGTGKTAAFLVALYNRLLFHEASPARRHQDPRAVILAPTRELAVQIEKDARQIGCHAGLKMALIYGGVDYEKQRAKLAAGVDIVVATPGRLIDFVKQRVVSFRAVEIMVLDEADRMFDLGFIKDIRFLLRRMPTPNERQNLLFSATLSHRVLELAYEHMNDPEKLVVESDAITAANVRQTIYFPASEEKLSLLLGILSRMDASRSIVFVNTKYVCERVALALERAGYRVGVLSGDVPQKKREALLARFKKGDLSLLVATDVAARGLHIPEVSHVFNYDLPFDAEDYVHRIGRTARLGAVGDAISFACEEYAVSLPDIEAYIDQKIPVEKIDPALLLEVPKKARADGRQAGAGVVEDAVSEARAERKRRRERRDGERKGSRDRAPREGKKSNQRRRPQHQASSAARKGANRGKPRSSSPNSAALPEAATETVAVSRPVPPARSANTLRARLKEKFALWWRQFLAPSRRG